MVVDSGAAGEEGEDAVVDVGDVCTGKGTPSLYVWVMAPANECRSRNTGLSSGDRV